MTSHSWISLGARVALAAGFLSAVGDRFGLWGRPGAPNVVWGNWANFVDYTSVLNWFAPRPVVAFLAAVATAAEVGLALLLIAGYQLRWTAYASGVLLLLFAIAMTFGVSAKAPLDYSVFAAAAAAFLLGANTPASRTS